ncbi:tumor necrosis factor ligand superfamily member 6-like isoform X1 [Myxocyprinus asiaticus]|uniref:tumor necrosis factor ligand superfamily member 6-like isoform X1 n=1 Tax=Myxocyprinus asiaticus TaxID=70543 RepID=UPI002223DA37|nr:tumor necrosis factor ligand superfamily member 6-like isoform X1 [Myxocyprinus asiaticus]
MFCNTFSRHTLSSLTPSHTSMSSANMNGNFDNTSPPVFMVDSGGGYPKQRQYYHEQVHGRTDPVLVPCWTFPPARAEDKRRGCGGMNVVITWILALILLLVFAALGLGAYQILRLQSELERLTQKIPTQIQSFVPQRQVGLKPAELDKTKRKVAAHLIGYADQNKSSRTLKWEVRHGEAFTDGVKYINGGLQVNETGLYFVYSRVEFVASTCNPKDSLTHTVFVKRNSNERTIMEDHRDGFCLAGSKQPWTAGSHLGSLQHLKQFDWLFVNVSHPHLLSTNYHHSYFGLFRIH